jgi:cobalt-zinc-cadmium efflux system outer membrane protein
MKSFFDQINQCERIDKKSIFGTNFVFYVETIAVFFLISAEIGHCQDTLQLNIAQIVDLCFSQSFTIKSLEIENEIGKSLLIAAKIRPNLELNNQTLQLTDAKYFQAGHPSIDFSHQQNWTQLTKSIQFPGVRKTKMNYAEAAYSTLMNQNKSESMVFLKEVMQKFALLDYHQMYHKILQKEINDILNIKKLHATKTRKELTLSEINRIEQIELFYNVLLEQNQIDLLSVQSILSSQLRTNAFFKLDSFQFYEGANSLLPNTFSVDQSVAFKTEDLRLEEYKLRKQMQEKIIFPPAQFCFIHNPQN